MYRVKERLTKLTKICQRKFGRVKGHHSSHTILFRHHCIWDPMRLHHACVHQYVHNVSTVNNFFATRKQIFLPFTVPFSQFIDKICLNGDSKVQFERRQTRNRVAMQKFHTEWVSELWNGYN